MNNNNINVKEYRADVIVVGGGISGTIAAISAARNGVKTILIHDRPVLGGNASSEVRVHIGGATQHGYHYDSRESGIIEEIRLSTAVNDPYNTSIWLDTELYTKCIEEPLLDIILNCSIDEVLVESYKTSNRNKKTVHYQSTTNIFSRYNHSDYEKKIIMVSGCISGSETRVKIYGKIFLDGTGHGTLGFLSGAKYRYGCESKYEFNESLAPENESQNVLGASILFRAEDRGFGPKPFSPPSWAIKFTPELLKKSNKTITGHAKNHGKYWHSDTVGWWWVELGGNPDDYHPILDNERIRHDLHAICWGIWDYIKNKHPKKKIREEANNYEITWIGSVPGHRESRRIEGDYILNQNDVVSSKLFFDRIGYGGWSIDLHPGDFWNPSSSAEHTHMEIPYSIPYRSIFSKNVANLLLSSRCLSVTHVAHGTTRLIATLATVGQAAGSAAAICIKKGINPRNILTDNNYLNILQQNLLKNDCCLLGIPNRDENDLALNATISASSELPCIFEGLHKFVPLFFPLAQRFYLPPLLNIEENLENKNIIELEVYLKNSNDHAIKIEGGLRCDHSRLYFTDEIDIADFSIKVPKNFEGWISTKLIKNLEGNKEKQSENSFNSESEQYLLERDISNEGNYWFYLKLSKETESLMENEDSEIDLENIGWGMSYWHWPGTRIGYFNEDDSKWHVLRAQGNVFYDRVIGPRGTFNFQLKNVRSPYPASHINNGFAHPLDMMSSNLWISNLFSFPYIPPFIRSYLEKNQKSSKIEKVNGKYSIIDIETAQKRIYTPQYGRELPIEELDSMGPKYLGREEIYITLSFEKPTIFSEIHFKFDTDLDNCFPHQNYHIMKIKDWPIIGKAPTCIRDLDIYIENSEENDSYKECKEKINGAASIEENNRILIAQIRDNYQRFVKIKLKKSVKTNKIFIIPLRTWGFPTFNIYEIRIYK